MNEISKGQTLCLLLCAGMYYVFSGYCAESASQLAGIVLNAALTALLLVFSAFCFRKRKINKVCAALLLAALLVSGAEAAFALFEASSRSDFIAGSPATGLIALAVTVIYCASLGITAAARSSVLFFAATVIAVVLLCVGAYRAFLRDCFAGYPSLAEAFTYGRGIFSGSGVIVLGSAMLALGGGNGKKAAVCGAAAFTAAADVLLSVLAIESGTGEKPTFFSLAATANPFSVQSGEWIYIVIYGLLGVLCLSLSTALASACLKLIFPRLRFSTTICAVIVFAAAIVLSGNSVLRERLGTVAIFVAGAVVPPAVLFFGKDNSVKAERVH